MNLVQENLQSLNSKRLQDIKVGVVTSRFNWAITQELERGAKERLVSLGLSQEQILFIRVPGALEIPLAVQALFKEGCDGVVALGAVIRGETSHYDYVCAGVERGCSHLQLKFSKPIGFGVLTTENEEQAMARAGGAMGNKGAEAAETVVEMMISLESLKSNQKGLRKNKRNLNETPKRTKGVKHVR